ncbi:threonine dehydratase I [Aureobasidium pullulans]|nr:threonine dehydratase I [Aureobasidium pullulans]
MEEGAGRLTPCGLSGAAAAVSQRVIRATSAAHRSRHSIAPSSSQFLLLNPVASVSTDMAQNGTSGQEAQEPVTPKLNSLSLTEYATNPSPPSQDPRQKAIDAGVPESFLLPNGYPDYLRLILTSRVYDVIEQTPLTHAVNLSNRLESQVFLKREDLLPVFSFKLRGAYNKMAHLSPQEKWKGVVACSAGNHAQGVAYSARKLKMPATITMPLGTPAIKHTNVSRLGGAVVLHGNDFDEAKAECARLAEAHGLTNIPPFDDPYLVATASGANMDFDRLRFVAERAAIGEKKEALLMVAIPERPGAFAALVKAVHPMSVTEFCYRYASPTEANVLIGISLNANTREHDLADLIHRLSKEGMTAVDISENETAKSHIRYLVGGRSKALNERVFAFEFPERQGALFKFLTTLQPGFNISLFHYRNHGGDIGKVLAGIQCPQGQEENLNSFLTELGYGYVEETNNPVFKMFMTEP